MFLPFIVHLVKLDDSKRLLALHALKEVVTHTSTSHLENLAETLWVPLFENSENADETSRGVAAACIGKLITTHPARYLPQVHVCLAEFVMIYVCSHVFLSGPHPRPECCYTNNCAVSDQVHFR